jgi:hypothetical protein
MYFKQGILDTFMILHFRSCYTKHCTTWQHWCLSYNCSLLSDVKACWLEFVRNFLPLDTIKSKKNCAETMHILYRIQLTMSTLPEKQNLLVHGRSLLFAEYQVSVDSIWLMKSVSRRLIFHVGALCVLPLFS